jgi:hypothetical protein
VSAVYTTDCTEGADGKRYEYSSGSDIAISTDGQFTVSLAGHQIQTIELQNVKCSA